MNENRRSSLALTATVLVFAALSAWRTSLAAEPDASAPQGSPTAQLQRLAPGAKIGAPQPTPVSGIVRVKIDSAYVYLTADGRYAFAGDLLDLTTGENLTDRQRDNDHLAALAGFPPGDLLIYPADGTEKARIHVFTDSSCPYCRKLQGEVPALRKAGVTVAYIPFPRGGEQGPGYKDLRAVWCADDRSKAMDIATGVASGKLGPGDCAAAAAVDAGYRLGMEFGVRGTPTLVLPSGAAVSGYLSAQKLTARLGLQHAPAKP
jgi:thiol:disulfide interchange protein DsbC